jgi:hypothetical protein
MKQDKVMASTGSEFISSFGIFESEDVLEEDLGEWES